MKNTRFLRYCPCFAFLIALTAVLLVWNISAGSVDFAPGEIWNALFYDHTGIIWNIRLPRDQLWRLTMLESSAKVTTKSVTAEQI